MSLSWGNILLETITITDMIKLLRIECYDEDDLHGDKLRKITWEALLAQLVWTLLLKEWLRLVS